MGVLILADKLGILIIIVFSMMIPLAFASEMGFSMSAKIMPYDYADNPILELNDNTISWTPYAEDSKFDIIRDGKEIIKDTTKTSYQIKSDGCYHIEDESHYRVLDSNKVCLRDGVYTITYFKMNEPPTVMVFDTLEIVIWEDAEQLTHLNACNHVNATGCYDPNNHRIHISWETMGSLLHELQHSIGIDHSEQI